MAANSRGVPMRPGLTRVFAASAAAVVVMVSACAESTTSTTAAATTAAPTTTAAPATTTTTAAPATTTTTAAPATTTTTAAPATTTTTAAPTTVPTGTWVIRPWGLDGGVGLSVGMPPDAAVATGLVVYDGPDFTVEQDGFSCGFGDASEVFPPAAFAAMFLDEQLVRIYIAAPSLRTPEGLGVGSLVADVEATLGVPDDDFPGHYLPSERNLLYTDGDTGVLFVSEEGTVVRMSVGFVTELYLVEGCL